MRIATYQSIVCLTIGLLCGAVDAQFLDVDRGGSLYRLSDEASYQEGCFEPCLCPISALVDVRGTFVLGRPVSGDVVDFREVSQINWIVGAAGTTLHSITGSGNYRITNFGSSLQHALELELSIDGGEPQHFFSDFVPVDSNDGSIDIPISMNGQYCYDIVIRVSAEPLRRDEILDYILAPGSTYQQGCFDPCDCILEEPVPLRGRFGLVNLFDHGTYAEYAIVNAGFALHSGDIAASLRTYTGFGRYALIQGFAGPLQDMELTLTTPLGEVRQFDSGLHNAAHVFPAIDITVDMNDMVCFDRVLTIRARRPRHTAPMLMSH